MTILYTDTFVGANADPIGGNYTTVSGCNAFKRLSNVCRPTQTNVAAYGSYLNSITPPNDQIVKMTATTALATIDFGPLARVSTSAMTFYLFDQDCGGNVSQLYKCVASTFNTIGSSFSHTHVSGDVYEIRTIGTTITGWINGVQRCTGTDSAIASGRAGFYAAPNTSGDDLFYTAMELDDTTISVSQGAYSRSPFGKVGMNLMRPGSQLAFTGSQTVVPTVIRGQTASGIPVFGS